MPSGVRYLINATSVQHRGAAVRPSRYTLSGGNLWHFSPFSAFCAENRWRLGPSFLKLRAENKPWAQRKRKNAATNFCLVFTINFWCAYFNVSQTLFVKKSSWISRKLTPYSCVSMYACTWTCLLIFSLSDAVGVVLDSLDDIQCLQDCPVRDRGQLLQLLEDETLHSLLDVSTV